jgi:hypothetical protein
MSGWQPIETAPRDGTPILGWCSRWPVPVSVCRASRDYYGNFLGSFEPEGAVVEMRLRGTTQYARPTHWMPLPAAPKEGER